MFPRSLLLTALLAVAVAAAAGPASPQRCGPEAPDRQLLAGELALAQGLWPAASHAYACAAAGSDSLEVAERATRVAFELGQLLDAERSARRWLALAPEGEEPRRFLATSLLRLHRHPDAAGEFRVILDTVYPDRAQGYGALLGILSAERNETGAARVMDALAASDTGLAEAQHARSVLWQQAEHGARALDAARVALELRPGWRMAELAEVRALLLLGQTDEGLQRSAALAADGDPLSSLNHAWLLVGAGRDQAAREAFHALRRGEVAVPQALEGLGALAYQRRDFEEATRLFNELLQGSPGNETALAYLGLIAEDQGKPALAARYLERVVGGPRAVGSQLRLYRLLAGLGQPERAELALQDFMAESPGSALDLVIGRAQQLADAGQGDAALGLVRRAGRLYPDDDDLGLAEALLLEKLDRVPEAVALLREVLARRPDDPTALNSLGYTLVDRGRQPREGYRLIQLALQDRPDSYAIMDSAGWALFKLDRPAEALDWLERAWERSRDPEVAAHLGAVLWSQRRRDEARALWDQALADAPDNRSLRRVLDAHRD